MDLSVSALFKPNCMKAGLFVQAGVFWLAIEKALAYYEICPFAA